MQWDDAAVLYQYVTIGTFGIFGKDTRLNAINKKAGKNLRVSLLRESRAAMPAPEGEQIAKSGLLPIPRGGFGIAHGTRSDALPLGGLQRIGCP